MLIRALSVAAIAAASTGAAGAADYGGPPGYRERIVVEREVVVRPRKRVVIRQADPCPCLGLPWGGAYEAWVDLPWGGLRSACPPVRRITRVVVTRKG